VDAFWLSPIYPSPLADFGYDVSNYTAVDPAFGTLEDLDELVARAHERGLRVLLDLVPSHTSIEHPWFREHPDWYIWSPVDAPPQTWTFPLPLVGESEELEHVYSADRPEAVDALAAIREAAGDNLLLGEVYLPAARSVRYLEQLDLVFSFELLFSPWEAEAL